MICSIIPASADCTSVHARLARIAHWATVPLGMLGTHGARDCFSLTLSRTRFNDCLLVSYSYIRPLRAGCPMEWFSDIWACNSGSQSKEKQSLAEEIFPKIIREAQSGQIRRSGGGPDLLGSARYAEMDGNSRFRRKTRKSRKWREIPEMCRFRPSRDPLLGPPLGPPEIGVPL